MSNDQHYLGVDPGKQGGLSLIDVNREVVSYTVMPSTPLDLILWLRSIPPGTCAVLEKVGGHVGKQQPGSRMFNFGKGVGHLEMALIAQGISYQEVTPQVWQRKLAIPPKNKKSETDAQWKERLRRIAQQMFPKLDLWKQPRTRGKQLAIADALLISEYCRRLWTQMRN